MRLQGVSCCGSVRKIGAIDSRKRIWPESRNVPRAVCARSKWLHRPPANPRGRRDRGWRSKVKTAVRAHPGKTGQRGGCWRRQEKPEAAEWAKLLKNQPASAPPVPRRTFFIIDRRPALTSQHWPQSTYIYPNGILRVTMIYFAGRRGLHATAMHPCAVPAPSSLNALIDFQLFPHYGTDKEIDSHSSTFSTDHSSKKKLSTAYP